jgi:hypothetical protein
MRLEISMCKNTILLICTLVISTILSAQPYSARAHRLFTESGASAAFRDSSTWVPSGAYLGIRFMNGKMGSKSMRPAFLMWLGCFGANMAKYAFPRSHSQLKREAHPSLNQFIECPAAAIMLLYNSYKIIAPENMSRLPYIAAASVAISGSYYYNENPQLRSVLSDCE